MVRAILSCKLRRKNVAFHVEKSCFAEITTLAANYCNMLQLNYYNYQLLTTRALIQTF